MNDSITSSASPANSAPIRLNVGCGGRPLAGYVNIDQDSLEAIKARYPGTVFDDSLAIEDLNIFQLPYADGSVDEVRADALLEHLSFKEEPLFLYEVKRVLRSGGVFTFSVPDFERVCKNWLDAKDDWQAFFSDAPEDIKTKHWFGTHSYGYENRWGYIVATIYGSQNGSGQFHKNCYSAGKIQKMMEFLGFADVHVSTFLWKGDRDPMLSCVATKR
jgi:predicted SAM-dependent methyltransferase